MIEAATRALVKLFRELEPNTHLSQGSIMELAALPAIILAGPLLQEVLRRQRDAERITSIGRESFQAAREVPPRWYNMRFNAAFSAKGNAGLIAAMEKCSRLPQQFPLLTAESGERARQYSWRWVSFPSAVPSLNVSGVAEGRGELVISDVEVYSGIREIVPLIRNVGFETPYESFVVEEEA